jgi:Ca-activated chloride channel homolog
MVFENPDLFHLFWALLLLAVLLTVYWQWRRRTLARLGSNQLEQRLLLGFSQTRFWLKNGLFAAAVVCLILSIANPQQAERKQPPPQQSADIVWALDVSRSMLAADAGRGSRLRQAQEFIREVTPQLAQDRLGLIFFAGEAFPQMPLSNDPAAVMMFAANASPEFITDQGTNIASAVELATRLSEENSNAGKALLLISDGENHDAEALEQVQKARESGWTVYTFGTGTPAGATIPERNGGMKHDFQGNLIRTSANESLLRELARAGGGQYFALSEAATARRQLVEALQKLPKVTVEAKAYTAYSTLYQWFLLPAILLLIIEQLLWWRLPSRQKTA